MWAEHKDHELWRMLCLPSERTGRKLSTHGWGMAIDLNPETNLQGAVGDMDAVVIEIFRRAGFEWGGDWRGKTRDRCGLRSQRYGIQELSRFRAQIRIWIWKSVFGFRFSVLRLLAF
jgi:hypothetical protein